MDSSNAKITDIWGRPFDYNFDAAGKVTITSLGADLRPGGDGENRDMVGTFRSRDPQGQWQHESIQWEQGPFTP